MIAKMEKAEPEPKEMQSWLARLPMRDVKRALSITGGNAQLAEQMFALMLQDLPAHLHKILRLQQEKNWRELKLSVHRLRGSVTYCAVPALEYRLRALESAAASKKPSDIERCMQTVRSEAQRLIVSGETPDDGRGRHGIRQK